MLETISWCNMKFRGVECETEKIIVGETVLIEKGKVTVIFDEKGDAHEIEPDSVKQFLFTDAKGNDVFVGDLVGYIGEPVGVWEADYGTEYGCERLELREAVYEY